MKKKRSFTVEQKIQILREAEENGMLSTCRKYEIALSLYYRWKNQFDLRGIDGLQGQYYRDYVKLSIISDGRIICFPDPMKQPGMLP